LKALTLYQPWASLIVDGRKPIETRPRPWAYVGRFYVHAGNYVDRAACLQFGYDPDTIETGVILGTAEKYGCVKFPHPDAPPDPYGDYTPGRYGYLLRNPHRLLTVIKTRGWQGIWEYPNEEPGKPENLLLPITGLDKVEA
jgi:hypothetical protein